MQLQTQHTGSSASKSSIRRFVITEKALISCVGNPISCLLTVGSTPSKGLLRDCEIFAKLWISFLSVHVLTERTLAGVLDGQVVRHILHDYEKFLLVLGDAGHLLSIEVRAGAGAEDDLTTQCV